MVENSEYTMIRINKTTCKTAADCVLVRLAVANASVKVPLKSEVVRQQRHYKDNVSLAEIMTLMQPYGQI